MIGDAVKEKKKIFSSQKGYYYKSIFHSILTRQQTVSGTFILHRNTNKLILLAK